MNDKPIFGDTRELNHTPPTHATATPYNVVVPLSYRK